MQARPGVMISFMPHSLGLEMNDKKTFVLKVGEKEVSLPHSLIAHLNVRPGDELMVASVPGAVVIIPTRDRLAKVVQDALSFLNDHDQAFGELSSR